MPSTSTTVHKLKKRPLRITATNSLGQPSTANLASSSANNNVATIEVDPGDNRRYKILGVNEGATTVTIGSGPNALTVDVTVEAPVVPPDQVNRVDLVAFETEE